MPKERIKVPCGKPDLHFLPYCPVVFRGYNINCDMCLSRKLWDKFMREDNKGRK